jgi:hypothetical protein
MPASIRMLFREERGVSVQMNALSPSNEEAREVFHRHPRLADVARLIVRCRVAPSLMWAVRGTLGGFA